MRVFLGGRAVPREEFALAGLGESTGVPVVLLLEDGEVFTAEDYISLGYTNYEVWCVGAVGGRGGDATDNLSLWRTMKTAEVMPAPIWADVVNEANMINGPSYVYTGTDRVGRVFPVGDTGATATIQQPPVGVISWNTFLGGDGNTYANWQLTPEGVAWLQNPDHIATITHYLEPIIHPGICRYIGGGGGGGGLHVAHGLLIDLPLEVIAEVGQAGANGAPGQFKQPAAVDPFPYYLPAWYPRMSEARWTFLNRFPNGRPTIGAPTEGSPGGPSTFGDICQASGGKGGKPAIQWAGSVLQQYAAGGQGGIGESDIPGGGADGATTSSSPGKDGGWDGSVGAGGGGGRGGVKAGGTGPGTSTPPIQATEGGRGSLNFGDTSVYGARGGLGAYSQVVPTYSPITGDLVSSVESLIDAIVNPGTGGGARVPGNRKYGSRAKTYSPDGAVLIRITKLD